MRWFAHHESSCIWTADDVFGESSFDVLAEEIDSATFRVLRERGYSVSDHVSISVSHHVDDELRGCER